MAPASLRFGLRVRVFLFWASVHVQGALMAVLGQGALSVLKEQHQIFASDGVVQQALALSLWEVTVMRELGRGCGQRAGRPEP